MIINIFLLSMTTSFPIAIFLTIHQICSHNGVSYAFRQLNKHFSESKKHTLFLTIVTP